MNRAPAGRPRPNMVAVVPRPGPSGPTAESAPEPALDRRNEELVAAYQTGIASAALDVLLRQNEPLLHHVLRRFRSAEEPYEDLFQVARLGLIKAAQRFDPAKAGSFSTYAVAVVDGEVRHHLRDNLLLRQPRWAKHLYHNIQRAQHDFYQEHGRSPSVRELAEAVNVREEGVLEVIRCYGMADLHSLDEPFSDSESTTPDRTTVRSLRHQSFSLPIEDRILLYDALRALSDVHKKIIYLMFFKEMTQQQVADEMGLTQRTVSREQTKALSRLKAVLGKKIL